MSVRSFFDTNILVYTDDADAPHKRMRALALWEAHRQSGHAVVSVQVLQEYFAATTRKLGVDPGLAIEKMMLFSRADVVNPSAPDAVSAARLSIEHKLSFWDAMIVHMADQAGCAVLFSEDLQAGRRILGMEIVDPFKVVNETLERGLAASEPRRRQPYRERPSRLGEARAGYDLNKALALAAALEDDEILRKLEQRK